MELPHREQERCDHPREYSRDSALPLRVQRERPRQNAPRFCLGRTATVLLGSWLALASFAKQALKAQAALTEGIAATAETYGRSCGLTSGPTRPNSSAVRGASGFQRVPSAGTRPGPQATVGTLAAACRRASSATHTRPSASSSRSASERSDRRASEDSRPRVPKSGLASTAITRNFEVAGEEVADDERARRLAYPALGPDQRDGVRAGDGRERSEPLLELGFLQFAVGNQEPLEAAMQPARGPVARGQQRLGAHRHQPIPVEGAVQAVLAVDRTGGMKRQSIMQLVVAEVCGQ